MNEEIIPSSQETSDAIKPISRNTVHKICSGQVVISLAIAVKELVENAIDAEATIIDIRLKEYGSELIEVSDNGKGVNKENFQALTLKHYTSKIRQFSDLETIGTLGFRGEALSSLCALSDLTILTKDSKAEHATKLKYDSHGKIREESVSAREQGTTVLLENLFSTLRVRRVEFLKNLKREFNKMCQLLHAYCLVCKEIKFTCTNTLKTGSRSTVVSTNGSKTVRENIINIFSTKQLSSLIDVNIVKPEEAILTEYGLEANEEQEVTPFSFEFLISSVTHGSGRSATDRQFFYINSRPCEPTKIAKLINGIYRQYNSSQYPFVYLNITTKSSLVDVNVTPDKRQIFIEKEKYLLATIKASLHESFKLFPSAYKMQNVEVLQNSTITSFFEHKNEEGAKRGIKRNATETTAPKRGSLLERFKKRSKTENDAEKASISNFVTKSEEKCNDSLELSSDEKLDKLIEIGKSLCESEIDGVEDKTECSLVKKPQNLKIIKARETENSEIIEEESFENSNYILNSSCEQEESKIECSLIKQPEKVNIVEVSEKKESEFLANIKAHLSENSFFTSTQKEPEKVSVLEPDGENMDESTAIKDEITISFDTSKNLSQRDSSVTLNISIDDIKKSLEKKNNARKIEDEVQVRFRSEISPDSNTKAEEELEKQFSKNDFGQMTVIGQFNLGFIIAKLRNDLFIVDQHASDEKYNFEQLQANTIIEKQNLVNPKQLELTAANESLLIENEDIFNKNGFTFKISHSAPCTKKVALTAVPISKNFVFGKDDIDEMLFMLQDSSRTMCRPSRLRGMFASRACRKSVMVGKHLTKQEMKKLLQHMGEIEHPWNCPHGRPTMRHLLNLDLVQDER